METLLRDFRYSLRLIRKSPGFAALAITALALGIGANTAMFSVIDRILLRPLAYKEPDRLVVTLHAGRLPVSPPDFLDYQRNVPAFEAMGAAQAWSGNLTGPEKTEVVPGLKVTANLFPLLGVPPLLGREFTKEDEGSGQVLLLSYRLWQRRFGGDSGVVGGAAVIDGKSYTIVGVMPARFQFAPFWQTEAEMWTPLPTADQVNDRGWRSLRVFARLRPGITVQQAQAQMDSVARRLAEQYPATNTKVEISVIPLKEKVVGEVRPTLLVLLGTVAFVLVIACANVANLLLTRALARRREIALRITIGAGRWQIVRQLLVESLLFAGAGGAAGLGLAYWGVRILALILPPGRFPRQEELGIDGVTLGFAAALSMATGLIAGLAPAFQLWRADLNESLKDGGRSSSESAGNKRVRGLLVAGEVALALVLLAGAGLMIRTLLALQSVDAGFDARNLLTLQVSVRGTQYDQLGRRAMLFRRVRDSLTALPGVTAVSAINHLPVGGDLWSLGYTIEGRPAPPPGKEWHAVYRVIEPGYFATMKLPLLRGRDFSEYDTEGSLPVAIINQIMARRQWPGEDPLGKQIVYKLQGKGLFTIVGVAKDARQSDWTAPLDDEVYLAYRQRPDTFGLGYMTFVVRTQGEAEAMALAVAREVARIDRSVPVSHLQPMEQVVAETLWRSRVSALLLGIFAAIALALATVGIYGVIAYSVRRRTQEIGIRMALGAARTEIVRMALREGMRPVLLGAAVGVVLAFLLARVMAGLLYGVRPGDPLTFVGVTVFLVFVAAMANLIPAHRAARVDPLIALRHE